MPITTFDGRPDQLHWKQGSSIHVFYAVWAFYYIYATLGETACDRKACNSTAQNEVNNIHRASYVR